MIVYIRRRQNFVLELRPRPRPEALAVTPHGALQNLGTPQEANHCYHLTTVHVREVGSYPKQDRSLALGRGVRSIERISHGYCRRKCIFASDQAEWANGRVRMEDQGTKDSLYTLFFVANIAAIWKDLPFHSCLLYRNFHHLPFPRWLPP